MTITKTYVARKHRDAYAVFERGTDYAASKRGTETPLMTGLGYQEATAWRDHYLEQERLAEERRELKAATALVRSAIKKLTADFRRATGERVYTHYADGRYAATLNCGTAWLDYEVQDRINDALEAAGLPFEAEYLSDYEIGVTAL